MMKEKRTRKEIRKYDVISGVHGAIHAQSRVYVVLDIYGATGNGSVDVKLLPICKVEDMVDLHADPSFPIRNNSVGKAECIDLFVEDIVTFGKMRKEDVKALYNISDLKPSDKNKSEVTAAICIIEIDSDQMIGSPNPAFDPMIPHLILDGDMERRSFMERYEIDEMIMNKGEARDFLRIYQELPDSDIKQMYGMSTEELKYAIMLLKRRYDYKNPNPRG